MKPLCDLCGTRHESYQAHVFASNAASNAASNRTASNNASELQRAPGVEGRSDVGISERVSATRVLATVGREDKGEDQGAKKQRWSREAYNAYQREYMRKRRVRDL